MFLFNIKVISKDEKLIDSFLKIITTKNRKKKNLQVNFILIKYSNTKNKSKKFSVLTSPNANKNAQEQFSISDYSKRITLFTFNIKKFLILLKKLKQLLFSEVTIQIEFLVKKISIKKLITKILNPENFFIKFIKKPLPLLKKNKIY